MWNATLMGSQVQAIALAMQQRADQLQLPMPRLVVGQNIARSRGGRGSCWLGVWGLIKLVQLGVTSKVGGLATGKE